MLVLSRRVGERLLIGDDIVITVIEVRSDGVRIGIDAPREISVNRAEVIEAVTAANLEATAADEGAVDALRQLRTPGRAAGRAAGRTPERATERTPPRPADRTAGRPPGRAPLPGPPPAV